ncbi:MAG: hypothetical protein ABR562_03650 [Thermoplasmatota archaeon]
MAQPKSRIELTGPMDLALPDGSTVSIRPGPHGKGISIVPQGGAPRRAAGGTGRGRGRPPRPSTLELRVMLAKDAAAEGLQQSSHYIDWLVAKEPKVARTTLQQTVYREMRAVGAPKAGRKGRKAARAGTGARGRAPHPATLLLREKLAKDGAAGALQAPAAYIRWVVDKADIGIRQARPIVYRELRAAKK